MTMVVVVVMTTVMVVVLWFVFDGGRLCPNHHQFALIAQVTYLADHP